MELRSEIRVLPQHWNCANDHLAKCVQDLNNAITNAYAVFEEHRNRRPGSILWTPLLHSHWLSEDGLNVFVKLETEQVTNSFKARGALYCTHAAVKEGIEEVVTASTGNHALAVVHATKLSDICGTVFLPRSAAAGKVHALKESVKGSGTNIEVAGEDCLEAELAARKYARENSTVFISPYNDTNILAGQGTIGVEILDSLSALDRSADSVPKRKCCYVTVGGGGLISGIAACLKAREPGVWRIVGCLPHNSPVMYDCVNAGRVVGSQCLPTLSDGSAGGIEHNSITLEYCTKLVDAWALITEQDIAAAIGDMFVHHRKVLEGAAAVALAGFQRDSLWRDEHSVSTAVIIACGSNINPTDFANIIKSHDR